VSARLPCTALHCSLCRCQLDFHAQLSIAPSVGVSSTSMHSSPLLPMPVSARHKCTALHCSLCLCQLVLYAQLSIAPSARVSSSSTHSFPLLPLPVSARHICTVLYCSLCLCQLDFHAQLTIYLASTFNFFVLQFVCRICFFQQQLLDCNNWRGITLLSLPCNVMVGIILNRTFAAVDDTMSGISEGTLKL